MVLHCVAPAASGGENALLDHEIAYLLLRDADPGFIAALMQPDAMTIPARSDDEGIARAAETGPVFSVDPDDGALHMRYTARTRSIEWKNDRAVRAAAAFLEWLLANPSPYIFRVTLQPGMGLLVQQRAARPVGLQRRSRPSAAPVPCAVLRSHPGRRRLTSRRSR